jgi:hypothetical protein
MQVDRNDNCHIHLPEKRERSNCAGTYCLRMRDMHLIPDLAHKVNRSGKTFGIFACFDYYTTYCT